MKKWTRVMYQPNRPLKEGCYVTASKEHIALSREAAAEGMVLLKNEHNLLPLKAGSRIALFGKGSFDYVKGGGGSGDVTVSYVHNLYDGFQMLHDAVSLYEPLCDFYRANVKLTARQAADERFLLFNMYTRDIVSVSVNGKPARRLFPDRADAQSWTTRDCFARIRPDEYDNRFDVSGLLKKGDNEIVVVYENLGHAHGYFPMEELAGIRQGGLSLTESALTHPLQWEFAADAAGVTAGWTQPGFVPKGWQTVKLDTEMEIPRKGNGKQPKGELDGLFTWYRIEFELPEKDPAVWIPWLARVNASGNGYMWLNGHNIGRHWEAGPQREYYLPECWLNFGSRKNVLVMGLRQTANGAVLKAVEIAPYAGAAEVRGE